MFEKNSTQLVEFMHYTGTGPQGPNVAGNVPATPRRCRNKSSRSGWNDVNPLNLNISRHGHRPSARDRTSDATVRTLRGRGSFALPGPEWGKEMTLSTETPPAPTIDAGHRPSAGFSPAAPVEVGIERVGVVGSGTMGAGIAELAAVHGLSVVLAVSRPSSLISAPQRPAAALDRKVAKQKLTAAERNEALSRITVTADLSDLGDRQFVIEAVPEDRALKLDLFSALDPVLPADTVLASTTSAISVTQLAGAVTHPERVIGVHFFNPVVALPLVEIVPTLLTDDEVTRRVTAFVSGALGKEPIPVSDRSGFVVNALLIPYLIAAVRMVESGVSSAESVDRAMELGCAHPLGPLRLCDLIGLDVVVAIAEALYAEFKQPLYAPPSSLLRMVESGILGRKTGRGFYTYP